MMYGLLGQSLGHSYSPFIHRLLGSAPYELVSLPPDELGDFLTKGDFKGLNVTIPYKKAVIPYLDHIATEAAAIGAVNTIVRRQDGLWGYNTDYKGFLYAASRADIDFKGKKVLVLGSGGGSAAVQAAVRDAGAAEVLTVSRTGSLNYENVYDVPGVEIIVNATPVGMYPNNGGRLIELARFASCCGVMDLIYNPLKTQLILDAEQQGLPCAGGLAMLVAQAKYASDLFLGQERPDSVIEPVLEKTRNAVQNIVLVGMPGCGKSTLGRKMALEQGKRFVDTDALVEEKAGKSIPAIFAEGGEATFRALEAEVLAAVCKEGGQVIATGGGSVLSFDNVRNMRQNGTVVFVKRDIDKLPVEGRPLSQQQDLKEMYVQRLPFYEKAADVILENI